jgi:hypothetical protein
LMDDVALQTALLRGSAAIIPRAPIPSSRRAAKQAASGLTERECEARCCLLKASRIEPSPIAC